MWCYADVYTADQYAYIPDYNELRKYTNHLSTKINIIIMDRGLKGIKQC